MLNLQFTKNQKLLGMGCSTFGGSKSKKTSLKALSTAYDKGIVYYDVARSYGYGQAESIVGEFLKGKRHRVILATKFGISPPKSFPFMSLVKDAIRFSKELAPGLTGKLIQNYSQKQVTRPIVTPELALQSLETSLQELRTDFVDIFLLHDCPYDQAANEDVCAELEKAKDAGKIRSWGATCEEKEGLKTYFSEKSPFKIVQFPYSINSPFLSGQIRPEITRVVFSVMSRSFQQSKPAETFYRQLPINQIVPGLIGNLGEAWLYVALQELTNGIVLSSMTQEVHIERNIDILNAPGISAEALMIMKQALLTGRIPAEPVIKVLSASGKPHVPSSGSQGLKAGR